MTFKKSIFAIFVWFIMFFCIEPKAASSQQNQSSENAMIQNIKALVKKEMAKNKAVGLSVAIVDSKGAMLSEGFGKADKANAIPADSTTLFPIASITKTFTGVAVMQLVEQGLVDLDKPVSYYIPALSLPNGAEDTITVRMLLTHHSGLHGDVLYNWYLPEVSSDPLIYEQIVDLINQVGTVFTPGKMHSYCNAGYSLLGVLIHEVSGMGYVEYIRTQIFEPLGMNQSIVFAGEQTNQLIAKGYDGKRVTNMPMKMGIPAGGIALSAVDAAKYLSGLIESYHQGNDLLRSQTMKHMMRQQNGHNPLDKGFAMGLTWFLQHPINRVTKYAAHRGELPPYHAMMVVLPEQKLGVLIGVNTNKAATLPDELAHKIIINLYEHYTGQQMPAIKQKKQVSLSKAHLKQYEGVYPNVYFGPMQVKLKGNRLKVISPAMPTPLVLIPHADTTFSVKASLLGIKFSVKQLDALKVDFRAHEGEQYMCFNIQNRMLNPNLKIEHFEIPRVYAEYDGKYKVVNMDNSGRVVNKVEINIKGNGKFSTFKYTFLGRHKFNMVIEPIDKRNARFAGVGYFMGDKIRWDQQGAKVFMYWSGLKLEKIN